MIDILLAFGDVFWKVAALLVVFEGLRYLYRNRKRFFNKKIKDMLLSFAIYFVFLGVVVAGIYIISKDRPRPETRDLLEPRNIAAEKKFDVCWEHKPDAEDRASREFITFQEDYKRLGCPEFMLYLDECDAECRHKSVGIIRRSFFIGKE